MSNMQLCYMLCMWHGFDIIIRCWLVISGHPLFELKYVGVCITHYCLIQMVIAFTVFLAMFVGVIVIAIILAFIVFYCDSSSSRSLGYWNYKVLVAFWDNTAESTMTIFINNWFKNYEFKWWFGDLPPNIILFYINLVDYNIWCIPKHSRMLEM